MVVAVYFIVSMGFRYEIRLSGTGGQGVILAGIILAEATGIYEGKYVAHTQSYGPEARGGASRSDIVISDEEIDYPKVLKPDLLLAMSQRAFDDYYKEIREGGHIIIDSTYVTHAPVPKIYKVPFTKIAQTKFDKPLIANIIALALIAEVSGVVSSGAMREAILSRVPPDARDINEKAFEEGVKIFDDIKMK